MTESKLRFWEIALLFALAAALMWGSWSLQQQDRLERKMIRLHVIANSDSEADQALKLQVRDRVLTLATDILRRADSREQAERDIEAALPDLQAAAADEIAAQGYSCGVTARLERAEFPEKDYDGFSLPAGEYLALRVVIGEGQGRNWWCVVFPPLCTAAASDWEETAIACGIVGTYIVARRLVFISGGITHASFGGLGLGFYLGVNPIWMALAFAILSAFGVEWVSKSQDVREDSAIAGVWSLGMALGVIFIFLTPGYAPNLSAYLFGNILTITTADLWAMLALVVGLSALFLLFLREIVYVAFDRDFAQTQGLPVKFIEYALMCCVATTIVLSIRMVGIMLLMSLLTLPQITMNLFTSDFKKILWGSILIGFTGCISGLLLSYYLNVPSGAFIILFLVVVFLALKAIKAFIVPLKKE